MKTGKEDLKIFPMSSEKEIVKRSLDEIQYTVTRTLERIERFKQYEGFSSEKHRDYSISKEKERLNRLTVAYEKWKNNITQKST